jgi:hypothetical protein
MSATWIYFLIRLILGLFNGTVELQRLYAVVWYMVNEIKRVREQQSWSVTMYFKRLAADAKRSRQSISISRFERGTSKIPRRANHSTTTWGKNLVTTWKCDSEETDIYVASTPRLKHLCKMNKTRVFINLWVAPYMKLWIRHWYP